jgi:hypothetical protein
MKQICDGGKSSLEVDLEKIIADARKAAAKRE